LNRWRPAAVLASEQMMGRTERIGLGETTLADEREIAQCEENFAALVQRQSRFVFRVAYAVLRNSHDAEDVAQEVFLKLYRARGWDKINDERAYLSRMAWRVSVEKRARKGWTGDALHEDSVSPDESPEQTAMRVDWSAVVHRLMDALPKELRLPLALSTAEELTSGEIAAILTIPEGTVRTRLMKARALLKQKLARLMGEKHER
jgi:RNA polymerase sigma-70 factor (ECF subfamily)